MYNSQIVYIIGFMGSGKSTTGKKLASLLDWHFADLDRSIEKYSGKTISEIFSQYGEIYFRNVESEVLKSLKTKTNSVISTGGGTPCFGDNMDFMLETGLTLYLKLTPSQLKSRLADSKGERPLIKDLTNDGLLHFIEDKLAFREKWYNRAEITVEGFDPDINQLVNMVRSGLIP
jgi:shikimate kinase